MFIGLWFSAYSANIELTDDVGVRKGTCASKGDKLNITMTGNQTFIFFNPAISHIIIDGKRLSTSGNKGLYLNGKNAIIDKFSEDTKYIVYFLPPNTCPLISIYAFGGKKQ